MRSLRVPRPVAAAGAMLTCPCHAFPLVLLLSGTSIGAFLYLHLIGLLVAMGALFLLSLWLLWQTRDSRTRGAECASCADFSPESSSQS